MGPPAAVATVLLCILVMEVVAEPIPTRFSTDHTSELSTSTFSAPFVFNGANKPSARCFSAIWRDTKYVDLVWVFGGNTVTCQINGSAEMWVLNTTVQQWAFVGGRKDAVPCGWETASATHVGYGVESPLNWPAGGIERYALAPSSEPGMAYMLGGYNNDLSHAGVMPPADRTFTPDQYWRWNSTSRMWSWWGDTPYLRNISVPNAWSVLNTPGTRRNFQNWLGPDGSLWVHGGNPGDVSNYPISGYASDLWNSRNIGGIPFQWRAIWPTTMAENPGWGNNDVYGTRGVESGGRPGDTRWASVTPDGFRSEIVWMFGGQATTTSPVNPRNTLWRFNMTSYNWAWCGGIGSNASTPNPPYSYGIQGVYNASNIPFFRILSIMFPGSGASAHILYAFSGGTGTPCDMWSIDVRNASDARWTWISGSAETCTISEPTVAATRFTDEGAAPVTFNGVVVRDPRTPYVTSVMGFQTPNYVLLGPVSWSMLRINFAVAPGNGSLGLTTGPTVPTPACVAVRAAPVNFTNVVSDPTLVVVLELWPPVPGVALLGNRMAVLNGNATFTALRTNISGTYALRASLEHNGVLIPYNVTSTSFTFNCSQPNCAQCSLSNCITCNAGWKLFNNSVCVTSCPAGTYTSGALCIPCATGCATCLGDGTLLTGGGGQCQTCDEGALYGVNGFSCVFCGPATGYYLNGAAPKGCVACSSITGCISALTCTSAADSQCSTCAAARWLNNGVADSCDDCQLCSGKTTSVNCTATSDAVCRDCVTCAVDFPGTYSAAACTRYADTRCANCTAITACDPSQLVCTSAARSLCLVCQPEHFKITSGTASDVCQACAVCTRGSYAATPCSAFADTGCLACTTGCADCVTAGVALSNVTCRACDEASGWARSLTGTSCVASCPLGQWRWAGNGTAPAQCMTCTPGCRDCTALGLTVDVCVACNTTAGFLRDAEGAMCVNECDVGQFRNSTANGLQCAACVGVSCYSGSYATCSTDDNAICEACSAGCAVCTGPGANVNDRCQKCADGTAPNEHGDCTACDTGCGRCSSSPSDCTACLDGYSGPPTCLPVCTSPGCLSCEGPEACGFKCDAAFAGAGCGECSSLAAPGAIFPACTPSRQTDITSTGATMGALALLILVVLIFALVSPLPIFYTGYQQIVTPAAVIPLELDFVLSTRQLTVKLNSPVPVEKAELVGLPDTQALPLTQGEPWEKEQHGIKLTLTKSQCPGFLAGTSHINVTTDAGLGPVVTSHDLRIHMRANPPNIIAIVTIVIDFIQLSALCFGDDISWWTKDPVPPVLRYSLIQIPLNFNLWYYIFWAFAGVSVFFFVFAVILKSGLERRISKRVKCCAPIFAIIYETLLPFIGQTLYLPIITVMLGVMACSKPVTIAGASFTANFDPERVTCWAGDHWIYVAVAVASILMYYPLAVLTFPLWQTVNAKLDVRYFPTFLIVSGQVKFILAVTSQLFSKIPFVQSGLLFVLALPVAILIVLRPPTVIYHLRWPLAASYLCVAWSGLSSGIALLYPNNWITSVVLYGGWALLLIASILAGTRSGRSRSGEAKEPAAGMGALHRVLGEQNRVGSYTEGAADPKTTGDVKLVAFAEPVFKGESTAGVGKAGPGEASAKPTDGEFDDIYDEDLDDIDDLLDATPPAPIATPAPAPTTKTPAKVAAKPAAKPEPVAKPAAAAKKKAAAPTRKPAGI